MTCLTWIYWWSRMIKQKLLMNTVKYYKFKKYFTKHQALPIQQKIQFEVSEIQCAPWNSIFGLHIPNPSHGTFSYCSCKWDAEEWYWAEQFCQMERDILVQQLEMNWLVKVDQLHNSQLVDVSACVCRDIWTRGKCWRAWKRHKLLRVAWGPAKSNSSLLSALQTSQVYLYFFPNFDLLSNAF